MNGRLQLEPTAGMPRQLTVVHSDTSWQASVGLPESSFFLAWCVGERARIDAVGQSPVLWVGDTSFELLEHEVEQLTRFFGPSLPVKPAAMGVNPPSPAPVVAGPSSEHHA